MQRYTCIRWYATGWFCSIQPTRGRSLNKNQTLGINGVTHDFSNLGCRRHSDNVDWCVPKGHTIASNVELKRLIDGSITQHKGVTVHNESGIGSHKGDTLIVPVIGIKVALKRDHACSRSKVRSTTNFQLVFTRIAGGESTESRSTCSFKNRFPTLTKTNDNIVNAKAFRRRNSACRRVIDMQFNVGMSRKVVEWYTNLIPIIIHKGMEYASTRILIAGDSQLSIIAPGGLIGTVEVQDRPIFTDITCQIVGCTCQR